MVFVRKAKFLSLFVGMMLFSQLGLSATKPTHTIVLVHGLLSDKSVFSHYDQALLHRLSQKNPDIDWKIVFFDYETGSDKSSYSFAKDLNRFLISHFTRYPLDTDDKFSLVMHSQGGIIGGIWVQFAASLRKGFSTYLLPFLENYVTIETPFWGSRLSEIRSWGPALGLSDFNSKEVADLSLTSNKSFDSRYAVIRLNTIPELKEKTSHIRFVNLVGIDPTGSQDSALNDFLGLIPKESDGVVEASSGHLNFIHGKLSSKQAGTKDTFGADLFTSLQMSEKYYINATHTSESFDPQSRETFSPTMISPLCVTDTSCTHPTVDIVTAAINKENLEHLKERQTQIHSFMVVVSLELPPNYPEKLDDINWEAQPGNGTLLESTLFAQDQNHVQKHIRVQELYDHAHKDVDKEGRKILRFYVAGTIPETSALSLRKKIHLNLNVPRVKSLQFEIPVQQGYSTFLDIDLETIESHRLGLIQSR